MKVVVTEVFLDKYTDESYEVGQMLNLDDEDRVTDLVNRGLVRVEEQKKTTKRRKASA